MNMTPLKRRALLWLPAALVLSMVLAWLLWPQPVAVDLGLVTLAPMQVVVSDEGETRVRDLFVISAPIAGWMQRVELEPGDRVVAGETAVASIEPASATLLDERTVAEGRAAGRAAASARQYAQEQLQQALAEAQFASTELKRLQTLRERNIISANDLDGALRRAKVTDAAVAEARAMIAVRASEYQQTQARLLNPAVQGGTRRSADSFLVRSPVTGTVLRVLQESAGNVVPGTSILEVGDPRSLELKVDLLSEQAIRVQPGQRVLVNGWGGDAPLQGSVRLVEPFGFTKVSALGIEEQRVNVVIDLTDPYERWQTLGHGYRVEPEIVVWETAHALQVPLSTLFRQGDEWAVFAADKGRAGLRIVQVGRMNGTTAQILSGLDAGQHVVMHPNDRIVEGTRVVARPIG